MSEPHVMSALKAKRAEIAGRIEHGQKELRGLVADLDSIDAAIRVFDPDCDFGKIGVRPVAPQSMAFRGEMVRIILSVLRETGATMNSDEITLAVMIERGLNVSDKRLVYVMSRRVGSALRNLSGRQMIRCVSRKPGEFSTWEMMPEEMRESGEIAPPVERISGQY